jgi:hypothetical protein
MLGRLLMVAAVLQMLLFLAGLTRRSYLVVALPVGGALAGLSALAFWVGYTMAYARWDEDEPPAATEPEPQAYAPPARAPAPEATPTPEV